jgi:dihydrodipicolinate synthase/N-acetylneuraminate lyase
MYTAPVTAERLAESVWAVPPLARHDDFSLNHQANRQMIAHLEAGGMTTLLYGGNAIMYHVALSEYHELLELLASAAAPETLIVPSVGPAFGMMMDQAAVLADFSFPTAMILPQKEVATSAGIAAAVARFVDRFGKPVVLYIRHDRTIEPETAGRLMDDGLLAAIKYAVVRDDPREDDYLRALVDAAGPERMLSGLGDQPAPVHMRQFGLASFTTGCGCLAPRSCMALLSAIRSGDDRRVTEIIEQFAPLEDLRNRLGPITVLHEAVSQAGIADMGPIIPLLSPIDSRHYDAIHRTAKELLQRC